MNTQKIYDKITNTIIEMLEQHKKSNYTSAWFNVSEDRIFAYNRGNNHTYRGINQLVLQHLANKYNYSYNGWLTFKQLSELGGKIHKGSKAAMVVYKSNLYLDKATGKNITSLVLHLLKERQSIEHLNYKKMGYLKGYTVFNISQIENLPTEYYQIEELEKLSEFERNEKAEFMMNCTDANIKYSGNSAHYMPSTDEITLPIRKQFKSQEHFYRTVFHELGHWSGHSKRLNRDMSGKFGSKAYAFEELIAELNTAYINAFLGYENTITNNVAYIDSWLSIMKNDTKFIVSASAHAQKASDFLFAFAEEKQHLLTA
jgi:antirestriction protein ArdC